MKTVFDNWIDIAIVVLYFVFVMLVGIWTACKKDHNTVKSYFLAGRTMIWFPIGASLFASNIGSEHFIGLAGSGAAGGMAVAAFEMGASLCLPLLGWLFLPVYLSANLVTMPEYLSRRFGGKRIEIVCTLLSLFLYICSRMSVNVYAGSVFVQQALGWNTYISIAVILAVTAVYTIAGGLVAVIYMHTLQTIIMLTGATVLAVMGFYEVGGLSGLMEKYPYAVPDLISGAGFSLNTTNITNITIANYTIDKCGQPREDAFHILRDPVNSDLPWPGVLIRSTFVSVWYWCADQVIVQRALAAKDIGHARGATIMAGYLKFLPIFLILMPGMISRVLYPETVACADEETCMRVCENPVGCSNIAYPQLILGLAPVGMRGLMMAVMMAAQMSSLTSFFNSSATLFTMDIWRKIRKSAGERELLIVGKLVVLILLGISISWIPLIKAAQQGQLFLYVQAVNGYFSPAMCSVYLLAILVPRVNEQGTFWGMTVGLISGLIRMVLDFIYPAPRCGEVDDRPDFVAKVHFTYVSAILLFLTALVTVIISFLTKRPDRKQLTGLTVWTKEHVAKPPSKHDVEMKPMNKNVPNDIEADDKLINDTHENISAKEETEVKETEELKPPDDRENDSGNMNSTKESINRKLYIKTRTKWILNINVFLLLGVYIFIYIIFH